MFQKKYIIFLEQKQQQKHEKHLDQTIQICSIRQIIKKNYQKHHLCNSFSHSLTLPTDVTKFSTDKNCC